MQKFFIGVDGGASNCIVRLEDEAGRLLGQAVSGPASVRLSVTQAWQSVHSALTEILKPLGMSLQQGEHQFHAGIGLAGCEIEEAYLAFIEKKPEFYQTITVSTDAHVACLGAHAGKDGAIIIAGTGVIGFQVEQGVSLQVAGWGFPSDDEGGGAWLGLQAAKLALQWYDQRLPESAIAKAVYDHFQQDHRYFVQWLNQANSTAYGTLAPLVVKLAESGDVMAINLLKQAARALDQIGDALVLKQHQQDHPSPCTLVGGLVPFIEPYIGPALRSRLCAPQMTPAEGAIFLNKQAQEGDCQDLCSRSDNFVMPAQAGIQKKC